jgi:chaperonin GroES
MIEALMDQVVIEPRIDKVSKGGIILVEKDDNRIPSSEGTVVAVGPGKWESGIFVKTNVKVGSRVLYHNYPSGVKYVTDEKRALTIIQERQIVAVLTGEHYKGKEV